MSRSHIDCCSHLLAGLPISVHILHFPSESGADFFLLSASNKSGFSGGQKAIHFCEDWEIYWRFSFLRVSLFIFARKVDPPSGCGGIDYVANYYLTKRAEMAANGSDGHGGRESGSEKLKHNSITLQRRMHFIR